MTRDKQLALFPSATVRTPLTRAQVALAHRVIRTVMARGPLRLEDLARIRGADLSDVRFAVGVARNWGRVAVRDGVVVLATTGEEGTA